MRAPGPCIVCKQVDGDKDTDQMIPRWFAIRTTARAEQPEFYDIQLLVWASRNMLFADYTAHAIA